jgi:hypothetical protein
MTADRGPVPRRALMLAAVAATALPWRGARAETALVGPEDDPTLVVAGPADSEAAAWARLLLPMLSSGLMAGTILDLRFIGAKDGVTGANHFDARAMPDGSQALLFAGSLALPWMAGDSRVRFDMGHLMPLIGLAGPGVVMLRGGLGARRGREPVRLLCGTAPEPSQTALMALDLLKIPTIAVPPTADPAGAVGAGAADAVFLSAGDVPSRARALTEAGLRPAFTTCLFPCEAATPVADLLHGVPHFLSVLPPAQRADPLVAAWRAMAAASALDMVLALPRLSDAASVARWRHACRDALASDEVSGEIESRSVRLLSDTETAEAMEAMQADAAAQFALRHWMAERLHWRPA